MKVNSKLINNIFTVGILSTYNSVIYLSPISISITKYFITIKVRSIFIQDKRMNKNFIKKCSKKQTIQK